jgi:hypothetical protein
MTFSEDSLPLLVGLKQPWMTPAESGTLADAA